MSITSLQIGQKKIQCMLEPNITDYVNLLGTFVKKTLGQTEFYCYEYTATEDCFVRFKGILTNSENQLYMTDISNPNNLVSIHSRHMQNLNIGWDFFDDLYLMRKGQSIRWAVLGFTNTTIVKFSIK